MGMRDGVQASLQRRRPSWWVRRLTGIASVRELAVVGGLLVFVVIGLLLVTLAGVRTLSSVQAFTNGGSLYAQAQKEAIYYLNLYTTSRQEEHFERYRRAIAVPLAMGQARRELETADPDMRRVQGELLRGGMDSADLPGSEWQLRLLRSAVPLQQIYRLWQAADEIVLEIDSLARAMHAELAAGEVMQQQITAWLHELERLNLNLSTLEQTFLASLNEAAGRVRSFVFGSIVAAALLLFALALIPTRRILAQLKRSEEKFRRLFEQSRDAIVVVAPDGRVSYANPAAFVLLGYPPDAYTRGQVESRRWDDYCLRPREHRALVLALQRDGTVHDFEMTLRRIDGTTCDCLVSAALIRDPDGKVIGYESIIRDVTERRRTGERLRMLERAVEASGSAVFICDATRSEHPLVYVNPAFVQMTGYDAEEVLGKPLRAVLGEIDQNGRPALHEALQEGTTCKTVMESRRKDGVPYWHELNLAPVFDARGRLVNFTGVLTDVTEAKQAEEALYNALAREKELSDLQARFISMMSHEFRTPLAAILSSAELVERFRHTWSEERIQKHLHRIQTNVQALTSLLENVLIIGKAKTGKLAYQGRQVEIGALCRELVEDAWRAFGDGRPIDVDLPDEPVTIAADPDLLRYILSNLLSNAAKYSSPESPVRFEAACQDRRVVFRIVDRGIGIPEEDIHHVFEPFYRAGNAETIPGTGLGLSIVKRAVELHGGSVQIISSEGHGTTVTVSIPVRSDHVAASTA